MATFFASGVWVVVRFSRTRFAALAVAHSIKSVQRKRDKNGRTGQKEKQTQIQRHIHKRIPADRSNSSIFVSAYTAHQQFSAAADSRLRIRHNGGALPHAAPSLSPLKLGFVFRHRRRLLQKK